MKKVAIKAFWATLAWISQAAIFVVVVPVLVLEAAWSTVEFSLMKIKDRGLWKR